MIVLAELNKHNYETTPDIDANLFVLLDRINQVRELWNKPMVVTSGLRSEQQQEALIASGKSTASKSRHLTGNACDIQDLDGSLYKWCQDNVDKLETIGLWMEDGNHTHGWVHFQTLAPHSGNRFFIP